MENQQPGPHESESRLKLMLKAGYLTPKQARLRFSTLPTVHGVRKWMKVGVCNRNDPGNRDSRIKLRHEREGSLWLTTDQWIADFKKACLENVKHPSHDCAKIIELESARAANVKGIK